MKKNLALFSLLFLFSLFSLNNPVLSETGNKTVYLEGLYATSVFNEKDFGAEKLFDHKKDSWITMPGAATDEGVFLVFEKPVAIAFIKIKLSEDQNLEKIKTVSVFANGSLLGDFPVSNSIEIQKDVKNLYIMIKEAGKIKESKIDFPENPESLQDVKADVSVYDSTLSSGIEEISFFDKNQNEIFIKAPLFLSGKVTASSMLKPEEAYHTDYLFDSKKEFGWADGNEKKNGKNENLLFQLDKPVIITKIKLWNGYQRSKEHFKANEKVKKILFGLTGEKGESYSLKDSMDPQLITLAKPLNGSRFELKISDIYSGSKYKDLVISEISFYNGSNWFKIRSGEETKRKENISQKVKNTPMEKLLDKRIAMKFEGDMSFYETSLIFRSNSSFVLWMNTNVEDNQKKIVADGNWEIKDLKSGEVTVRIFGKIYSLSETYEYYKGNQTKELTSIFQEKLKISAKEIKGEKIFSVIKLIN